MNFSASLDGTIATITRDLNNGNVAPIRIEGATNLGDELLAFLTDPNQAPVDNNPAYYLDPTDSGVRVSTAQGHIDLHWRWITPVANALNA